MNRQSDAIAKIEMKSTPPSMSEQAPRMPAPQPGTHTAIAGAGSIPSPLPVLDARAATELQDHLLIASNDLDRLQRLVNDASDTLLGHFNGAVGHLDRAMRLLARQQPDIDQRHLHQAMEHLAAAITGMQFQDMTSQLLNHTTQRILGCADRLASAALGDDEEGRAVVSPMPARPNPVTQDEMDAGSIELF
jgi:hypothetical protein